MLKQYTSYINFNNWASVMSPYPCKSFTDQEYFNQYVDPKVQEEFVRKFTTDKGYRLLIIYRPNLNPLILFDPYEINRKFGSNGLFQYYETNINLMSGEDVQADNELRIAAHMVFEILYSLPEDKVILYLPTVLIFIRLASLDRFIKHSQFFDDKDSHTTFIEEFKHDSFMHNRISLASGKVLNSPGLFANNSEYDAFTRSDTLKKMHAVCKFLFEHCISWTKDSSITDEHCKNLQNNIIKFCINSIDGKSFNRRKHENKMHEGFYPKLHEDSRCDLREDIFTNEVKLINKVKPNKSKLPIIGYIYSKTRGREFDIFQPLYLGQTIVLKKNGNDLPEGYKQEYFTILKGILQTKDLVDQVVELEKKIQIH